jgi:LysR family transcriptional regulator, glycine cleavage system transcriptional activator
MNQDKLRRYPAMQALVGFATVARTLSLARAAEQLNLSASAVSKQLRELESFLGCELFERSTRSVNLTAQGRDYALAIQESLGRIEEATLRLRAKHGMSSHLDLAVSPTFCNHWLIPRLASFYEQHPGITLNLQTAIGVPNLTALKADCAISFCETAPSEFDAEPILALTLMPVAASKLVAKRNDRDWRKTLCEFPLLGQLTLPDAWREFLAQVGIEASATREGPRYQLLTLGHQATLVGLGIALLPNFVVSGDLRAKRLVRIGSASYRAKASYQLLAPARMRESEAFRAFRAWLKTAASESGEALAK